MLKRVLRILLLSMLVGLLIAGTTVSAYSEISLTQEERDYIEASGIIKAVSLAGVAPLQYLNSEGEVRGISWRVLEEISDMTGLVFEYRLYDTVEEGLESDGDIYFTATKSYAPENMHMSDVYLKTETILYMNSKLDANQLHDEIYAGVRGGSLPEGVSEEKRVDYDTREDSLDAVESGEAGYGYGNAYSVAFYTLQNNYRNIITIPKGKDTREYHIGMMKDDEVLLSIINKGLANIDEQQMQNLILDVTSHIERKVTVRAIMESYGAQIILGASLIIGLLLFSVIFILKAKNRLMINNRKYELLSHISNEYLYEYDIASCELIMSEVLRDRIDTANHAQEVQTAFRSRAFDNKEEEQRIIRLPLISGGEGIFKSISSVIYDGAGKAHSIIGKLVDISQEHMEKEMLIAKSQIDGLTGLYNADTVKSLIADQLAMQGRDAADAFMLIDLDRFKGINDTMGHLAGDRVLQSLSEAIRNTFRATDIAGRIGGDEFCVYIRDIPSRDFIDEKVARLCGTFYENDTGISYTASIGITLAEGNESYEEIFARADKALYKAKARGLGMIESS